MDGDKHKQTGAPERDDVLLVIVGALGDWCIRRVLRHAQDYLAEHGGEPGNLADIVLVDKEEWYEVENCVAVRLIEQTAEMLDCPTVLSDNPTNGYRLLRDPKAEPGSARHKVCGLADGIKLPNPRDPRYAKSKRPAVAAIDDFCRNYVRESRLKSAQATVDRGPKDPRDAFPQLKKKVSFEKDLRQAFDKLTDWALGTVDLTPDPGRIPVHAPTRILPRVGRYWRTVGAGDPSFVAHSQDSSQVYVVTVEDVTELAQNYRIVVYVATPPQAYRQIVQQWAPYADRIALEKPISGLLTYDARRLKLALETPDILDTVQAEIRKTAADRARDSMAPVEILTIDHYTSKWALHAIDIAKQRRVIDHILARPQLVLVQVCESETLPTGRFHFYNGVGGALADMVAHLMQPLRAISQYGSAAEMLDNLRVLNIQRAQYVADKSIRSGRDDPFVGDYDAKDVESRLNIDTETFAVAELQFISGPWTGVDVLVRTGKGVLPQSKILRVYGPDDGEGTATVTFDIARNIIELGIVKKDNGRRRLEPWMESQPFGIKVDAGEVTRESPEYGVIFGGLCGKTAPDPRYFPPVSEAAKVFDFFRATLVRERMNNALNEEYEPYSTYPPFDPSKLGSEDVVAWEDWLSIPVVIYVPRSDSIEVDKFLDILGSFMAAFGLKQHDLQGTTNGPEGSWFARLSYIPKDDKFLSDCPNVFEEMREAMLKIRQLGGDVDQAVENLLNHIKNYDEVRIRIGQLIVINKIKDGEMKTVVERMERGLIEKLDRKPSLLRETDASP